MNKATFFSKRGRQGFALFVFGLLLNASTSPAVGQELGEKLFTSNGPINAIKVIDDQGTVLIGSQDRLQKWNSEGKLLQNIELPLTHTGTLLIASDRQRVWVGGGTPGEGGVVVELDLPAIQVQRVYELHTDMIASISLSVDEMRIATASMDGTIGLLELKTGAVEYYSGHSKRVTGVGWVGENQLVSVGEDMSLRLWEFPSGELQRTMLQHVGGVRGTLTLSGARSTLPVVATWGRDRTVRFWQPTIGRMMRFSRLDAPPLVAIWDAEIQQLIVGDTAGHLNWIDWETAQIQRRVMLVDDWITALAMSLDGNTLYVGTANGELWRVPISRDVPNAKQLN